MLPVRELDVEDRYRGRFGLRHRYRGRFSVKTPVSGSIWREAVPGCRIRGIEAEIEFSCCPVRELNVEDRYRGRFGVRTGIGVDLA